MTLPAGGTSVDYRAALGADIEARILNRLDRLAGARGRAGEAMRLWGIHTGDTTEGQPSPAMRFHLAMLHNAAGHADSASALLRSLVPPVSWLGFLTARASFELGLIEEQLGDYPAARHHYLAAVNLWELGTDDEGAWLAQALDALERVRGSERGATVGSQ